MLVRIQSPLVSTQIVQRIWKPDRTLVSISNAPFQRRSAQTDHMFTQNGPKHTAACIATTTVLVYIVTTY
jgi:hypothetical protein